MAGPSLQETETKKQKKRKKLKGSNSTSWSLSHPTTFHHPQHTVHLLLHSSTSSANQLSPPLLTSLTSQFPPAAAELHFPIRFCAKMDAGLSPWVGSPSWLGFRCWHAINLETGWLWMHPIPTGLSSRWLLCTSEVCEEKRFFLYCPRELGTVCCCSDGSRSVSEHSAVSGGITAALVGDELHWCPRRTRKWLIRLLGKAGRERSSI